MTSWSGISIDEILFRMARLHERLQVSLDESWSMVGRQLAHWREHPIFTQNQTVHHVRESLRHFLHILKETIRASPVARKCQESTERALKAILRRLLPIWTELSRNSLLAGTVGLVLGYSIARWWWWWRATPSGYSSQGCPMKDRPMLSLVRKSLGRLKTSLYFSETMETIPMPRILVSDQVLIRVQAVSLTKEDIGQSNKWYDSYRELVGYVEEMGHHVNHISLGQQVWTVLEPSMNLIAAFVVLPASRVYPAPPSMDCNSACTLPLASLITIQDLSNLKDSQIRPYPSPTNSFQSVFVDDATTCLGGFAIQLLQTWGIGRVVTCVPYRAVPLVKHLGVDLVIPLRTEHLDLEKQCAAELSGECFDLVLRTSDLLAPDFCASYTTSKGGKQVGLVVSSGDKVELNNSFLSAALFWPFRGRSRALNVLDYSKLIQVKEWVEADLIQATFYNVFDVTDLDKAVKYLQDKRAVGKCILDVSKLSNMTLMMMN